MIGLVGKGLTFDSGGYNLKVGGMIEMMKFDMGGAGAVLGAAQAIAGIKPEGVEVSNPRLASESPVRCAGTQAPRIDCSWHDRHRATVYEAPAFHPEGAADAALNCDCIPACKNARQTSACMR